MSCTAPLKKNKRWGAALKVFQNDFIKGFQKLKTRLYRLLRAKALTKVNFINMDIKVTSLKIYVGAASGVQNFNIEKHVQLKQYLQKLLGFAG